MYEIEEWDGLAKIGSYSVNGKVIRTPALLPVVDPIQQTTPISEMKSKFGFEQVITSAYLMSKRMGHFHFGNYPQIHDYLSYEGAVMMDSGAYQVMLYGDIELGVEETIRLQSSVKPDIGVIMDHPIGYDVSYTEAKKRVNQTIENIRQSIPLLDPNIAWTLPIQGGKYLDLLEYYLKEVTRPEIIEHFNFYALGSVVPVMINQDYLTLVEMIARARKYLPISRPLHLFGAGHPAMFALATFMGCDTFDSAAYVLMAKDNRYMTVEGTYLVENLSEFPCSCPVCTKHVPKELLRMNKQDRLKLLAEHNLYVSNGEIRTIRQHIHDGNLWDLVLKRANSTPYLFRATVRAIELVTTGILNSRFTAGIPATKDAMVRVTRALDLEKPLLRRSRELALQYILDQSCDTIICLAYPLYRSIYNRLPEYQLEDLSEKFYPVFFLPPVGLIPLSMSEMYPIGQMLNEINLDKFPVSYLLEQIQLLAKAGKKIVIYYQDDDFKTFFDKIKDVINDLKSLQVSSLVNQLNELFTEN